MDMKDFFNIATHKYSTKFSNNIKDYRLLNEPFVLDEYENETYKEYYEEYKGKGLFVVCADRDIIGNDCYYWLGDLIITKDNEIIDGIAFN